MHIDSDAIEAKHQGKPNGGWVKKIKLGAAAIVVGAGAFMSPAMAGDNAHAVNGVPVPSDLLVESTSQPSNYTYISNVGVVGLVNHHVLDNKYNGVLNINKNILLSPFNQTVLILIDNDQKADGSYYDDSMIEHARTIDENTKTTQMHSSRDDFASAVKSIPGKESLEDLTDSENNVVSDIAHHQSVSKLDAFNIIKSDIANTPSYEVVVVARDNDQRQQLEQLESAFNSRLATGTSMSVDQVRELMNQFITIHELGHAYDAANHDFSDFSAVDEESFADLASINMTAGIFAAQNDLPLKDVQTVLNRGVTVLRAPSLNGDPHMGGSYSVMYHDRNPAEMNELAQNAFNAASKKNFDFEHDMDNLYDESRDVFDSDIFQRGLNHVKQSISESGFDSGMAQVMASKLNVMNKDIGLFDPINYPPTSHNSPELERDDYIHHVIPDQTLSGMGE